MPKVRFCFETPLGLNGSCALQSAPGEEQRIAPAGPGIIRDQTAEEYLERGDYVRAAIYGLESIISAEVERRPAQGDAFDVREQARAGLKAKAGFRTVTNIRNALAHGVRPRDRTIARLIGDGQTLCRELLALMNAL